MTLGDICILKTNFEEADFWIKRKGSETTVGKPIKEFDSEDIGVKVKDEFIDKVLPQFLYYFFMNLHQRGVFIEMSHGTLALKNIRLSDIKNIPIKFKESLSEDENLNQNINQNNGLDDFMDTLLDTHPRVERYMDRIRKFITDSGCQRIEIKSFTPGNMAYGISLHDRVVINPMAFRGTIEETLYIIFHEIAHQYQYKKYGRNFAYNMYNGKIHIEDGVRLLRQVENTADQFAIRKCREFANLGLLDMSKVRTKGVYSSVTTKQYFESLYKFIQIVRDANISDTEQISEILYNYFVKVNDDGIDDFTFDNPHDDYIDYDDLPDLPDDLFGGPRDDDDDEDGGVLVTR